MPALTAQDIMTRKVLTVSPDLEVKAFAKFLVDHRISGAPVTGPDGSLLGIATESDIIFQDMPLHMPTVLTLLDAYFVLENPRRHDQELHKILGSRVRDIMTSEVLTVAPSATLEDLATIMHGRGRHLLPVVENGKLVGVVGKADLVRGIAREE